MKEFRSYFFGHHSLIRLYIGPGLLTKFFILLLLPKVDILPDYYLNLEIEEILSKVEKLDGSGLYYCGLGILGSDLLFLCSGIIEYLGLEEV